MGPPGMPAATRMLVLAGACARQPARSPLHSVAMSARPQCSVYIATSIDGYIARLDGSLDWLARVEAEGEDYGYASFFAGVDVLVIGRNTYDTVLGFGQWPYEGKRCVVLTNRPAAPWRASDHDPVVIGLTPVRTAPVRHSDSGHSCR